MATTKTVTNPRRLGSTKGGKGGLRVADVLVRGTGVTWKAGQFLRLCSDGLLECCTTSDSSGVGDDAITHYALKALAAAIGNDTTTKRVGIVHEDDLWEINEKSTTVARAKIGQQYGMDVTSGYCTLDTTITSHKVFTVINPVWAEQPYQNASDDIKAMVVVQVLATAVHATPTATDI